MLNSFWIGKIHTDFKADFRRFDLLSQIRVNQLEIRENQKYLKWLPNY